MEEHRSPNRPNRAANKEKAEGSRETVRSNVTDTERAGGITNRPLEREEREQDQVPPRGETKDEGAMRDDEVRDGDIREDDAAKDVGRTAGGGSLGHDQPEKTRRDTPPRNNATGSESDPVMPKDDSTLKTKI